MQQKSTGALMKFLSVKHLVIVALFAASIPVVAQKKVDQSKGFTEYETFQGTINSDSRLLKLDSTIGWDFNKNFGVFGGVPLYFTNVPASTTTTGNTTTTTASSSSNGLGNAYVGMVFRAPGKSLDYAGALTVYAPTGSTANGLSTGRVGVDFSNHFSHSFNKFTPFLDAGAANTVPDSQFTTRAFTSLGAIAHLEEGADYEIFKRTYAGISGYQIVPFGTQKIVSKLDGKGQGGNPFDGNTQATGTGLTRENGFNAWVDYEPSPFWRAEIGFSRSTTFNLNSLAFNLRFNVGRMLRSKKSS
jgi:hypothetical protein